MADRVGPEPSSVEGSVVIPCDDLDEAVERYRSVGFVLDAIGPADDPTWAELTVAGLRLVLDSTAGTTSPRIRLSGSERATTSASTASAPFVELVTRSDPEPFVPETVQALAVEHESVSGWKSGRAGMLYRDLIPDRHGGAYIASHIHIPDGGPVPDYVHYHDVSHQMIFCHRGWVRVVYQDQGPPFVMEPGDCVLQPPGIRHRVLEASDDLYVTEITCPATHRTYLDHDLDLPNRERDPDRRFGGQRFVRHMTSAAPWSTVPGTDFQEQVTGVAAATGSAASLRLLRTERGQQQRWPLLHRDDLLFLFVVSGSATLVDPAQHGVDLGEGSSAAVPAGEDYAIDDARPGTCLLELRSRRPGPAATSA